MTSPVDVAGIIDRQGLSRFQLIVFAVCAVLLFLDGFDAQMIGYVAPALVRDWHLDKAALGPIFSAGILGFSLGAMMFGIIADRWGRRLSSILCLAWFGVFTLLTVTATSAGSLAIFRFAAGLGLGGAMPNAYALVCEYFPHRMRATVIMLSGTGYALGAWVGGFVASYLVPAYGWHSVFYVGGGAPLLLLVAVIAFLPESIRFLVLHHRPAAEISRLLARIDPALRLAGDVQFVVLEQSATGFSAAHLFKEGRAAITLLLWLAVFMNLMALNFLLNWLPTLTSGAGMPMAQAMRATSMFSLGGTLGTLLLGMPIDRFGAHRVLALGFVVVALALTLIGAAGNEFWPMATIIFVIGFFVAGGNAGTSAFAGTLYPTFIRSTGVGWALGIGRAGALVGPVVGSAFVALHWQLSSVFDAVAIPELIAAGAIYLTCHVRPAEARVEAVAAEAPITLPAKGS